MIRMTTKFALIFGLALCWGSQVLAQSANCTRELTKAEEAFDQGRLQDVLDILNKDSGSAKDCFDFFTQEEKIRAEKLLTKVYIFTDNVTEAENSLVDLLQEDKEHQLAKDDPSELHFLYSQFQTEPIFRVGIRLGVNNSLISVLQEFSTFQEANKAYNPFAVGFNFETLVERHIKNGIEVGLGAQYRIATYIVDGNFIPGSTSLTHEVANRSSMFRVPLLARYNFNYDKKNIDGLRLNKMFYVFGGASFDLVTNAKYVSTSRTGGTAFTLVDEDDINSLTFFDQVATTNVSLFAGAGVKFRMGREKVNFLSFEVRYDNSLFNYINPVNRYANQRVNFDIGYVEDDLTINTVTFSVGYTHSFYNAIKRKQYR